MVTFLTFLSSLRMLMLVLNLELAGSFPKPLSAARERECLKRMSEGDQSARDELIEHNLRLVVHIIKKYNPNARDQDDLISIGTIGLIKAVSTFNCEKGARFATYASRCIENEILMNFRSKKKTAQDVYLFDPIDTDKDGNALTLLDIMADETSMVEEIENKMRASKLRRLVNELPDEREKEIIILRYGLSGGEPMTQRNVAQRLKISRSYVSRIEKKAIERLREGLSEDEDGDL
ncbi:MAG: RNA polymerase sporulation sigma factor SigK [Oscillospiraceae bacterium]|nr:RNA polymerase sporulation sigma factor SigK [Oscillospiraceae bacterium]